MGHLLAGGRPYCRGVDGVIRGAGVLALDGLGDVERDGDRRYRGYDGVPVGFDDTVAPATLRLAGGEGRLWVATSGLDPGTGDRSPDGALIGFALAEMIDGHAHVGQVSVRLRWQGRGVGRRLLAAVTGWAADRGLGP